MRVMKTRYSCKIGLQKVISSLQIFVKCTPVSFLYNASYEEAKASVPY
jgi:hypothetical protein